MTKIIGIVGGKGSGKSTVARYLARTHRAKVYALADELKALLREFCLLTEEELHGTQMQKEAPLAGFYLRGPENVSARRLMERMGDAVAQVFGKTFLVNRVLETILWESPQVAVISDVRYVHEADRIRRYRDSVLWRIHYPPAGVAPEVTHRTESEWRVPSVEYELRPQIGGLNTLIWHAEQACIATGLSGVPK